MQAALSGHIPDSLRLALDDALAGIPGADLARSTAQLISRYRSEAAAAPILTSATDAAAYAAYRMPATYAAVSAALTQFSALAAGFRPRSLLDVGGGTGAVGWAAAGIWPSLESVQVLERVPAVLELGRRLAQAAPSAAVRGALWRQVLLGRTTQLPRSDLITMSYLLGELPAADREPVLRHLAASGSAVALIEPGTPGFGRVIAARAVLIEAGLTIVAPCPHDLGCPVTPGRDWCHFAARVSRTALHRRLKDGALGHEDEKFSYLVAARTRWPHAPGRIVRHPRLGKGSVTLPVCAAEPGLAAVQVFKRDRELYRRARNASWGDPWPPGEAGYTVKSTPWASGSSPE